VLSLMNSTELDQIGLSLLVSVRIHEHNELRRQRLGHIFVALAPPWTSHRNGNCTVAPKQIFPRLIVHISHSCQQGQRLSDVLELQLEPVFRRNGQGAFALVLVSMSFLEGKVTRRWFLYVSTWFSSHTREANLMRPLRNVHHGARKPQRCSIVTRDS